jgi:hypothetical protein
MIALVMMNVQGRGLVAGVGGEIGRGFWFKAGANSGNGCLFPRNGYFFAAAWKGLPETGAGLAKSGTCFANSCAGFPEAGQVFAKGVTVYRKRVLRLPFAGSALAKAASILGKAASVSTKEARFLSR